MRNEDYTVIYYCRKCRKFTKHLIKELSTNNFKVFTKSDYITWCEICSSGNFIRKDEYQEMKSTQEVTTKAGGILWKALCKQRTNL